MSRREAIPSIDGLYSLKVDNLSYGTTVHDLRRLFERYGDIGDVHIPRDRRTNQSRGFGFVRFYDRKDAEYAASRNDGRRVNGRDLRVTIAKYDRPVDERARDRGGYRRHRSRTRSRSPVRRSRSRTRSSRSRSHSRSRSPESRSRSKSRSASRHSQSRSPVNGDRSRLRTRSRTRSRSKSSASRSRSGSRSAASNHSRSPIPAKESPKSETNE